MCDKCLVLAFTTSFQNNVSEKKNNNNNVSVPWQPSKTTIQIFFGFEYLNIFGVFIVLTDEVWPL